MSGPCTRTDPHPLAECTAYADATVREIMAGPHTIRQSLAGGGFGPWVLTEHEVRDIIAHGKATRLLAALERWTPDGCPACGRDIDRLGGDPDCETCAAEPPVLA